jgi:hypothetical protein
MRYRHPRRVGSAAVDSTGLECSAASGYFVRRRALASGPWKTVVYHRYPKLGVVADNERHFILAMRVGQGPRPDVDEFAPLLSEAVRSVRIGLMLGDAGYDSEENHRLAREEHGIRTVIPAKHGRPTTKPAAGHYRRLMQAHFDHDAYRDRAQVETVISMIKRRHRWNVFDCGVNARSANRLSRPVRLRTRYFPSVSTIAAGMSGAPSAIGTE